MSNWKYNYWTVEVSLTESYKWMSKGAYTIFHKKFETKKEATDLIRKFKEVANVRT